MSDFKLTADGSDIVRVTNDVTKFSDTYSKMIMTVVRESDRMEKATKQSSQAMVEAQNRLAQAQEKTASDGWFTKQRRRIQMQKDSAAMERRLGNEAEQASAKVVKANQQEATELERLKIKYKEGYAAVALYNKIKAELAKASLVGAISKDKEKLALAGLTKEFNDFSNGAAGSMNRFATAQVAGTKRMSNMGVVTQQAGYQIGDFAVQVQGGQSALVAFSQQATQLVGVLPLMSDQLGISSGKLIAISAGLGIGIPIITALAGVLWTVSQSSKDAEEKATRFEKALKSARSEVQGMGDDLRLLQSGFENSFELTLDDNIKEAEGDLKKALASLAAAQNKPVGMDLTGNKARLLKVEIGLLEEVVKKRQGELAAAQNVTRESKNLINLHEQAVYFLDAQAEAQDAVRAKAEETLDTIAGLEEEYGEAVVTALALAGVDLTSPISSAADEAARLAKNLGVALSAAAGILLADRKMENTARFKYSGRGTTSSKKPFQIDDDGVETTASSLLSSFERDRKASAAKRGGRSKKPKADRDDFVESLNKEMELRRQLLTVYGEERSLQEEINKIVKGLGKERSKYSDEAVQNIAKENLALIQQEELYQKAFDNVKTMSDTIENSMGDAFTSILDGTASVEDAFKNMAKTVIDQLLQIIIQQKIVGSFGVGGQKSSGLAGIIGGLLSFDGGGDTGDGPRSGGVDGKGGFMAVVHPNETIIDHTRGQNKVQTATRSLPSQKQQIELVLHAPEGITIETVKSEVSLQITQAAPKLVSQSVKASQNNLKNGSKSAWGI